MNILVKNGLLSICFVMCQLSYADNHQEAEDEYIYVPEEVIVACEEVADELGLEGDDWYDYVNQCVDDNSEM